MIDTQGMITVVEAAKRLNRSTEQVRRKLREGKLRGQRIGGQWFVDHNCLRSDLDEPLIPRELVDEINALREKIFRQNGTVFDVVELLNEDRESH